MAQGERQQQQQQPTASRLVNVDQSRWPVVTVTIGRGSDGGDPEENEASIQRYLQTLAKIYNDTATYENKPWVVFHIRASMTELGEIMLGPFMSLQTEFCKQYYERMQKLSSGFVVVIESTFVRAIATQLTKMFPTDLPLAYVKTLEEAEERLRLLRAEGEQEEEESPGDLNKSADGGGGAAEVPEL